MGRIKIGDDVKTPYGVGVVESRLSHRQVLRTMTKRDARVLVAQLRQKLGDENIGTWSRVLVRLTKTNKKVWLDSTDVEKV